MKYSSATLAALLAAQAQAQAQTPTTTQDVYKREAFDIAQDLQGFLQSLATQQKRDVDATPADLEDAVKRALEDTQLGQLLNSRDVDWGNLIQQVLQALPGLIKTIWDSGIIQQIVSAIWNNQGIRDGIFNAIKWVLNTILGFFTGGSSSGSAAPSAAPSGAAPAAAPAAQAQAKRMLDLLDTMQNDSQLSARDFADSLGQIISAVWNSGVIQSVFNWVVNWIKNNPDQFQSLVKSAFNVIVSLVGSIWNWAQQNGIIEKVFTWLGNNAGGIVKTLVDFLSSLLGGSKSGGSGDGSGETKTVPVSTATAAPAANAAAPAANAAAPAGGNNDVLASLQGAYGGGAGAAAPTTVQAKRMLY